MNYFLRTDTYFATLTYFVLSLVLITIGRYIYIWLNRSIPIKSHLVEQDNTAFAISHIGYISGIIIAIGGAMTGSSTRHLTTDLIDFGLYGLLALLIMNITIIASDKLIFKEMNLNTELFKRKNISVGIVSLAASIGAGLIVYGAISGDHINSYDTSLNSLLDTLGGESTTNVNSFHGYLSAIIFWIAGFGIFALALFIYNKLLSFNIYKELKRGNIAVSLALAGIIIAVANLTRHGIQHDYENWKVAIENVLFDGILAIVLLPVIRLFVDKIILPGQNLTDEMTQEKPNIGAGLIEAVAYIGCSILLDWTL